VIQIEYHRNFKKHYQKRIKNNRKLDFIFRQRTTQFIVNPNSSQLNNHQLTGLKKGLFSFSITGDIRVIYRWIDSHTVYFLDIGTHNQVY
jgi:addiction module RelE/StbE family toxin